MTNFWIKISQLDFCKRKLCESFINIKKNYFQNFCQSVKAFVHPLMSFFSFFLFLHVFNHFHAVRSINNEVFCCVLVQRGRLSASSYSFSYENPFGCVERRFGSWLFFGIRAMLFATVWQFLEILQARLSSSMYILGMMCLFAFWSVWISHFNSRHDSNVQTAWRPRCHISLSFDNWTLLFSVAQFHIRNWM